MVHIEMHIHRGAWRLEMIYIGYFLLQVAGNEARVAAYGEDYKDQKHVILQHRFSMAVPSNIRAGRQYSGLF